MRKFDVSKAGLSGIVPFVLLSATGLCVKSVIKNHPVDLCGKLF
ncbi:MAG: hypothetical protein RUDDFDWM_000981 [Candidatus Fervidibacterota bacterium]